MAMAADYDIVINNGRVMDPETNFDDIRNVGIKDGKIAVITTKKITGKETIDAKGLVVAPGFIDGHQHCIEPYAYRLMLRDGRTTIMDLEIGAYGPNVDKFYTSRQGNAPVNFGVSVAHEFARAAVLDGFSDWKYLYTPDAVRSRVKQGWSSTRPTLEQGNQILAAMDEGLRQGGLGLRLDTCEPGCPPARYSNCNGSPASMAGISICTSVLRPATMYRKSWASRRCWPMPLL